MSEIAVINELHWAMDRRISDRDCLVVDTITHNVRSKLTGGGINGLTQF